MHLDDHCTDRVQQVHCLKAYFEVIQTQPFRFVSLRRLLGNVTNHVELDYSLTHILLGLMSLASSANRSLASQHVSIDEIV